jgi:hypothetical protein
MFLLGKPFKLTVRTEDSFDQAFTLLQFHMERFNLKKLSEVEGKERYCVEISNRFAALENL